MLDRQQFEQQLAQVEARVTSACTRSGRSREEVQVMAVTKYVSLETTRLVLEQGHAHIGESRWQDASQKWEQLHQLGTWHFIGHLQSNKVKDVLGRFDYIHSLDRLSLAKAIHKKATQDQQRVKCFLQVNVSGEASKHGMEPEQLISMAESVREMPSIEIVGLMTMAPYTEHPEETRPVFRALRQLRDELNQRSILPNPVQHLSMGMSNDFDIAVEEGATFIRLGSVLVGKDEGGETNGSHE
ncbi:YggS family pyridoxal phosphate-dependent enzyme [Marinicrinis sediminis]|uniref:Pyridoxal phosphate homeostasis protein n=1 Tax=Marinicrinis sediminis TaxID=1652465 RepID=A0ABW5RB60_9BACL